ncbi:MAG TPA: chromosome segregation protein SMC [Alcaligenes sp.]|nr:chromosome segregation protein SMC [Alcaligenes sp.]
MRLTQIKLAGFKSFVDPTSIPTPSQLVGVVGPNGCGKSNIIDAVRWVLGESKASELRGESMQDVIFNGSGQRKPAGRASVELVFDNGEGRASGQWSTYAEISVRRVLTRDGTSSYFINNQAVRRRDIHDIFLGTGLGARGYAIIGQGMINRLIEAKPEELRVFLEEAAGVSRYKERRRETENRLKDTRENLLRVEDIQRELDAQLEKLQAQAHVARQYRDLQQEGELKQNLLWLVKEANAQGDQKTRFLAIEQAQTRLEEAMAGLRHTESSLESQRQAHLQAGDTLHAAQAQLYEAGSQVSSLEAEIRHVLDSRNRMTQRREQLEQQQRDWQEQQAHCQEELAISEEQREEAAVRVEEQQMLADQAQDTLPDLELRVRDQARQRDEMRMALARVEQNLALAAQSQRDADRQIQGLDVRHERLIQESRQLNAPDPDNLARLQGELNMLQAQLTQAQEHMQQLEAQVPELESERKHAQQQAIQGGQELSRLEARLQALSRLQEDVARKGTLEPWLAKHGLDSMKRLWQSLDVEKGWETALESVLRERMTALELRRLDISAAFGADAPPARLAFYQLPPACAQPGDGFQLPLLASVLRLSQPELSALMHDWLRHVYIGTDLKQALAVRDSLPQQALIVVREGHVVDRHSIRFYAPDSEQAGMLARQQEIARLEREVKASQLIVDELTGASARAESVLQQVSGSLAPARARVGELTRRMHDVQLEHSRLAQQAQQSQERAGRISEELDELRFQREQLLASREEAEVRFEELDQELAEHQTRFADAQIEGETLADQAERARNLLRERERAVQDAQFAERALVQRMAELQRNLTLAQEQAQRAIGELQGLQGELLELDASAAQAGLQEALELRAEREENVRLAKISLDTLAAQLRENEQARGEIEKTLQPLREQLTELQLQEQASRLAVEQFAEQLDARQVNRAQLRALLQEKTPEWQRAGWLQSEVQRISRQIEALGPVNLAALEELSTAQERKTYLDAQHKDLSDAIETLEDAIRKIDRETRQLLMETFNIVNQHFGELFPRLFGGGEAKLTLVGDEVLEAGVQVMAQPPGKRNSTIHLLSGGEKALTATALVFAFFKLNPAPFCLLDEVDAPLDDANTERYANLVASMSDQTQFLFISHNKIAMQMAKQLVGVTMQEQGVSRIVAVDVDAAMQMADA